LLDECGRNHYIKLEACSGPYNRPKDESWQNLYH
jgi:hypothetical protein